jgi:hypothetical protein
MKLVTSYNEVINFLPCNSGFTLFLQVPGVSSADPDKQIEITDCLKYCRFSDVVWLLGRREKEIQIAVKAAKRCADSVRHINGRLSYAAADAAAATADAADAADYAAAAANYAAADAASYAAAARYRQMAKNKQFLLEEILAYERANS